MDPNSEKELLEVVKKMSDTLGSIKEELSDISTAIREGIYEDDEDEGDEEGEGGGESSEDAYLKVS